MILTTLRGDPMSRLGFGAMQLGRGADAPAARAMVEACLVAEITHFDTAFSYNAGASEAMLGPLLAAVRDHIILATKAPSDRPATHENLRAALDQSRKRLGVDQIDLYYLHRFDDVTPLHETFEALARMQTQGLIRYIGVSNFAAWQLMKAQAVCARLGTRIDAVQPMFSLVKRQVEVEIMPACRDQGIALCAYSPLGGGLLTGKYARGEEGRLTADKTYAARYGQRWMQQTARDLAKVATELGVDSATLAVAWVVSNPDVSSTLISARTLEQLRPSLRAMTFALDVPTRARITGLSPTPAPATDRSEDVL
jgi:aryl-alcohol dehydrogenase-like predicted oxidoreductase